MHNNQRLWIFIFLFGASIFLIGKTSFVSSLPLPLVRPLQEYFTQEQNKIAIFHSPFFSPVAKNFDLRKQILLLEISNRTLQNEKSVLQRELHDLQSAKEQYELVRQYPLTWIGTHLVHTPSGPLLLAGKKDGIQAGSIITSAGALVGQVDEVGEQTSTVHTIADGTLSLALVHQLSGKPAVLRKEFMGMVVQFFSPVDIKPGDHFVSLGNEQGIIGGIPVATAQKVITTPSDSTTRVLVSLDGVLDIDTVVLVAGDTK